MSYTQIALLASVLAATYDLFFLHTRILVTKLFWVSYAVVVFFQLLTNGVLTGFTIVQYNGDFIVGEDSVPGVAPTFIGDGRIAFAPLEDLFFGFAMVVVTLSTWVWLGRRKSQ
jgi:hypothetical protein